MPFALQLSVILIAALLMLVAGFAPLFELRRPDPARPPGAPRSSRHAPDPGRAGEGRST